MGGSGEFITYCNIHGGSGEFITYCNIQDGSGEFITYCNISGKFITLSHARWKW